VSEHELDADEIRRRAYEISQGPDAGTPEQNWLHAVDDLRAEKAAEETSGHPEPDRPSPFPPNTAALTHP
jgi:hypothetical protein